MIISTDGNMARLELLLILLTGVLSYVEATVTEFTTKDYCLDEKFTATCSDHDVILIDSALYGRMTFGSCVQRDYGYIGCKVDVTTILANKCSGRRTCEVVNVETLFASYNRCPQDLKSYLQASFSCKQMTQPLNGGHCSSGYVEPITSIGHSGFISPGEKRWGVPTCPWRIRGQPGQRINITLHDYSDFGVPESEQPALCRQYFAISDSGKERAITACSHELRHRTIFVSKSHQIQLYFTADMKLNKNINFILEYTVEGCSAPVLPPNSYTILKRDNTATVQCNHTTESWQMTCTHGKWVGTVGNCTAVPAARTEHLIPLGLSIIIILGVALFVCTGVLVVGFLVLYCRRRRRHKLLREETRYYATHSSSSNETCILSSRTKHPSLEKTRTAYSPLTKTRTLRTSMRGGEYTHIWEVKHPIPVATPEVPKAHVCTFRRETLPKTKSSPTMTCARSPVLPERHRDREQAPRERPQPTFSTFKPNADPYGIPAFKGESTPGSSHSSQSSPLYFEIDTQRRKQTNHYST